MGVYLIRGEEQDVKDNEILKVRTPLDEYKGMTKSQFLIFARIFLKDEFISGESISIWQSKGILISDVANFFNDIPEDILTFSSDLSKKLLMKYIVSGLRFNLMIPLTEDDYRVIYESVYRLSQIYKFIKKDNQDCD